MRHPHGLRAAAGQVNLIGQEIYTTPGTYTWVAPGGVTSVSVVCVGGGGNGANVSSGAGGGGGALSYGNNIAVTPGSSYTVVVGGATGTSSFIDTSTLRADGGGNAGGAGGTGSGTARTGGGSGGQGGEYDSWMV
jgi:hypothetical protein